MSVSADPVCRDSNVDFRAACTVFLPDAAPPAIAMKMLGAIAKVVVGVVGVLSMLEVEVEVEVVVGGLSCSEHHVHRVPRPMLVRKWAAFARESDSTHATQKQGSR